MVLAEPTIVGRDNELEELMGYLNSALHGKGTTVFISGEAGSGKTKLSHEFLNRAKKLGVTVLSGWCLGNAAIPYFPFFEAFSAYFECAPSIESMDPAEVTNWLKGPSQTEEAGKPRSISAQAWKDQTFASVANTLTAISSRKPVILLIEDVHWSDSASLALIHYIARAISTERILLIGTFRSEQLTPDTEGRPHPLVETLRLMRRDNLFKEIKLVGLSHVGVSELAKNMLEGEVQEEFSQRLAKESQGNPLFVVESLRMLHEHNSLIRDRDQWRLTSGQIGIPEKIKDIVLQRLGNLTRDQRRVLEAASVVGEKFCVELLASLLNQDRLEIEEILDEIQKDTSLVLSEGEMQRFDHARTRDAIYDEISAGLKKGYHERLAEKLELANKTGKSVLSEIAYHYAQAGNRENAIKYALAAGKDALAKWSNTEAIRHFTYVLQSVGSDQPDERLPATEGLGDALLANSMCKEAIEAFENLGDVGAGAVRLRAYRKAMDAAFQLGDASRLMGLVEKANPYAAADRLENARVMFARARASHLLADFPSTVRDSETALQVFEEEYSLWDVASVLLGLGAYRPNNGMAMAKQGLAECLRAIAMFEELGDFRWEMEACWVAALPFLGCLLHREALQMLAKIIEIDEKMKMGDYLHLAYANAVSSRCFLTLYFEKSLDYSLKALEFSEKTDAIVAHGMVYSNLTTMYTKIGDLRQAKKYFEKLMMLPPEVFNHPLVSGAMAKAVFLAGKKQWKQSNEAFEEIFGSVNKLRVSLPFGLEIWYAWVLEMQGRFEEAKSHRQECQRMLGEMETLFEHADLQAHLMAHRHVALGDELEMRLDMVNVGRKPAIVVEIKGALPNDFKVTSLPPSVSMQNCAIKMECKELGAFQLKTIKFTAKSLKAGTFTLDPQAVYVDDLGETRIYNVPPVTIRVNLPVPEETARAPGKIFSGTPDLDRLLFGGIPERHTMVLVAPSSDEKNLIIKRFLEAGSEMGETTYYVTAEDADAENLAKQYPSNFYLIFCNPQADTIVHDAPNVFKQRSLESLTGIDITLAKAFRALVPSPNVPMRIIINVISDALLQHHAVNTRRWLSALLPTLKAKGFTVLAVIDPGMHPAEETQAILGLFEGEISIYDKETHEGFRRALRIRRFANQKYLEDEVIIDKRQKQVENRNGQ